MPVNTFPSTFVSVERVIGRSKFACSTKHARLGKRNIAGVLVQNRFTIEATNCLERFQGLLTHTRFASGGKSHANFYAGM
jgi:hypothetical protein